MSFYRQSAYLLLSSFTLSNLQKSNFYRTNSYLLKKKANIRVVTLLSQLFIYKAVSLIYNYGQDVEVFLVLHIIFASLYKYRYLNSSISKNIYWELQKLWDYILRSLHIF